jgi:hypothetical protein
VSKDWQFLILKLIGNTGWVYVVFHLSTLSKKRNVPRLTAVYPINIFPILWGVLHIAIIDMNFEPRRVFRRLICLSYAAMSDLSRAA